MPRRYPEITFTDSVEAVQERYGSRRAGEKIQSLDVDDRHLGAREKDFIGERDGFYMASVGETGWPYVQFRGGPPGFLKVLDESTLGMADYGGNRQYISTGNLLADDRAALILMDYAQRRRLKILARTRVLDAGENPEEVARVLDADYAATVERAVLFDVEAFDWNCPQHITPRFTVDEVQARIRPEIEARETALRERIAELEARLAAA